MSPAWMRGYVTITVLVGLLSLTCAPPQSPIRLGILVWPSYELFFVAKEKGYYPQDTVEFVEYRSPIDAARAYENGWLDAVLVTTDFALRLASSEPESRIALLVDYSNGADAILSHPDIRGVEELAGKTVGLELSSLGVYLLWRALDTHEMTLDDVELASVDYPELDDVYRDGSVDAVVVYEPIRSRLLQLNANEIFNSAKIPGEISDVLVVRGSMVDSRITELRMLVDGWFQARSLLEEDPHAAASIMKKREHVTEEQLLEALSNIEIPDRDTNKQILGSRDSTLAVSLQRLNETMNDLQLLRSPVSDTSELLDDRLVRELTR